MSKMIFVNLPVADLEKSVRFYEAIGGTKNPKFSNEQAADFLNRHLAGSAGGSLRNLVQLHLSEDCNRRELAIDARDGCRPCDALEL